MPERTPEAVARRLRELEAELSGVATSHWGGPFVYVAMGASDAVGIGGSTAARGYVPIIAERLRRRFGEVVVHNLGISGATLPEILTDELPAAVAARPSLVTLMAGGNDVVQGIEPAIFREALVITLAQLQSVTRRLVVATVPNIALLPIMDSIPDFLLPFGDKRTYVTSRCMALGRVLVEEAGRRGVRLAHVTTSDVLADRRLVAEDGFHPSDVGYARLADRFWGEIEPMLPS